MARTAPLPLQPPRQFGYEGAGHRRIGTHQVSDAQHDAAGCMLGQLGKCIRPLAGLFAMSRIVQHPRCDAPQIFDQRQPEHDRDGPQFTQSQRLNGLVGGDKTAEAFAVHPRVAVRNGLKRQVVHARQALDKPGQFAVIALGQMPLRGADLLLDQVEVIQQPLARGRDAPRALRRLRKHAAYFNQHRLVLLQPVQQRIGGMPGAQAMLVSQHNAVLVHLVGAEKLGTQRGFGGLA